MGLFKIHYPNTVIAKKKPERRDNFIMLYYYKKWKIL
jgi:hypothetical protein